MRKVVGGPILSPAGQTLPISTGVEIDGSVYLSGQLAIADGAIAGDGAEQQTDIILDRIEAILSDVGLGLSDVFKVTVWLAARSDFSAFNVAFARRFVPPYPVRSTVISELVVSGALVEIEVTASR